MQSRKRGVLISSRLYYRNNRDTQRIFFSSSTFPSWIKWRANVTVTALNNSGNSNITVMNSPHPYFSHYRSRLPLHNRDKTLLRLFCVHIRDTASSTCSRGDRRAGRARFGTFLSDTREHNCCSSVARSESLPGCALIDSTIFLQDSSRRRTAAQPLRLYIQNVTPSLSGHLHNQP